MNYLGKNNQDETILEIKHTYGNRRQKKLKYKLIALSVGFTIAGGGFIVGKAMYNEYRKEKITTEINKYRNQQEARANTTISKAEAFVEHAKIELATKDQYHVILKGTVPLYNEVEYTEDVRKIFNWKWKNEYIIMYGYGDAYFEYGTNLASLKYEITGDDSVTAYVAPAKINKETLHRVPGSYSPDPEKSNKTSKDAQRKAQLEMQFEGYTESKNNITQRAWVMWEDKYDENIESSLKAKHKEDGTLSSLDENTEKVIKELLVSLNTDKDVKITVKVDKKLK